MTSEIIDSAFNENDAKQLANEYQHELGLGWDISYQME